MGVGYVSKPCPNCKRHTFIVCFHQSKQFKEDEFIKVTCPNCCGFGPEGHTGREQIKRELM